MRPIVVLGGYGRLGRACALELAAQTHAPLRIAGRNAQRAESLALSLGERAAPCYTDAADPRMLGAGARGRGRGRGLLRRGPARRAAERARAARAVHRALAAAARARAARATWVSSPGARRFRSCCYAGALPGIPGILAESLVRRLPAIERLRIASTGAFIETETARRDQRAAAEAAAGAAACAPAARALALRGPVGARAVASAACADLAGFAESHCVGELEYLEPPSRGLARRVARVRRARRRLGLRGGGARDTPPVRGAAVEIEVSAPESGRGRRRARRRARCRRPRAARARRALEPARRARARRPRWPSSRSAACGSES